MRSIAARRYSSCMHGSTSADARRRGSSGGSASVGVAGTADRPIAAAADVRRRELRDVSARSGGTDPGRRPRGLPGLLPAGRRAARGPARSCWAGGRCCPASGCTWTAGSAWARPTCWPRRTTSCPATGPGTGANPKAFATFGELTQLAGVFGFVECIDLLANYTAVCIDEFELDDPGNTTLISRMLSSLVERGVSVAATSNTLPEQLGEGRFAAQDFLREINTLASIFTTVRIEGPDYRHRDLPPAPRAVVRRGGRRARRGGAGGDAGRLRCAVCASGHHASVAVPDADRGRDARCS